MRIPLSQAPVDVSLVLEEVVNPGLGERLRRMGVYPGSRLRRLDEEVPLEPVRVRGPKGEAVIAPGMAGKLVVHLDDGPKVPLAEMAPGERGHLEGRTGGGGLQKALDLLGLGLDDPIVVVRRLPPMSYRTVVSRPASGDGSRGAETRRVDLPEGIAAHILAGSGERRFQLCSAPTGETLTVVDILGGKNALRNVTAFGVEPGDTVILEKVAPAPSHFMERRKTPFVIVTAEGLRLYLEDYQVERIMVREEREGA